MDSLLQPWGASQGPPDFLPLRLFLPGALGSHGRVPCGGVAGNAFLLLVVEKQVVLGWSAIWSWVVKATKRVSLLGPI